MKRVLNERQEFKVQDIGCAGAYRCGRVPLPSCVWDNRSFRDHAVTGADFYTASHSDFDTGADFCGNGASHSGCDTDTHTYTYKHGNADVYADTHIYAYTYAYSCRGEHHIGRRHPYAREHMEIL